MKKHKIEDDEQKQKAENKWKKHKYGLIGSAILDAFVTLIIFVLYAAARAVIEPLLSTGGDFKHFGYWFWRFISGDPLTTFIACVVIYLITLGIWWIWIFGHKTKDNNEYVEGTNSSFYGGSKWVINDMDINIKSDFQKFIKVFPEYNPDGEPFYIVRDELNPQNKNFIQELNNANGKFVPGTKLPNIAVNGIPVKEAVHTNIIGSTGSGKTQKWITMMIFLNAWLKNKPDFVISDPKGEIYESTSKELEKQGYDVLVLNLDNPMKSSSWNPLAVAYDMKIRSIDFEKDNIEKFTMDDFLSKKIANTYKCAKHEKLDCNECWKEFKTTLSGLKDLLNNLPNDIDPAQIKDEIKLSQFIYADKYEKYWFATLDAKDNYVLTKQKELKNKSNLEVQDLVSTLIEPFKAKEDQSWAAGAEGLLSGLIYVMLEILEDDRNAFTKDQFNVVTIMKNLSNQDELVTFFKQWGKLHPTSQSWTAAAKAINGGDKARPSYFQIASSALKVFEDESLQDMVCKNDINLFNFDIKEKPKALYLIIPDQRKDKWPLASLFISQMYKAQVDVAKDQQRKFGKEELPRPLLFLLDEFGNLPKIPNFAQMMTVSRGRRMYFSLVLQDYNQLKSTYGDDATTIKTNCLLTIYFHSTDVSTLEEISKRIGDETIKTFTVSKNPKTGKMEKGSSSLTSKPLIKAADIEHLPLKFGIVINSSATAITRFSYAYEINNAVGLPFGKASGKGLNSTPINFQRDYWFDISKYLTVPNVKFPRTPRSSTARADFTNDSKNPKQPNKKGKSQFTASDKIKVRPFTKAEYSYEIPEVYERLDAEILAVQQAMQAAATKNPPDEREVNRLNSQLKKLNNQMRSITYDFENEDELE